MIWVLGFRVFAKTTSKQPINVNIYSKKAKNNSLLFSRLMDTLIKESILQKIRIIFCLIIFIFI